MDMCELAAHTLSVIIADHDTKDFMELENYRFFLNWLMAEDSDRYVSVRCKTSCLVAILKNNFLAELFVEQRSGFTHI